MTSGGCARKRPIFHAVDITIPSLCLQSNTFDKRSPKCGVHVDIVAEPYLASQRRVGGVRVQGNLEGLNGRLNICRVLCVSLRNVGYGRRSRIQQRKPLRLRFDATLLVRLSPNTVAHRVLVVHFLLPDYTVVFLLHGAFHGEMRVIAETPLPRSPSNDSVRNPKLGYLGHLYAHVCLAQQDVRGRRRVRLGHVAVALRVRSLVSPQGQVYGRFDRLFWMDDKDCMDGGACVRERHAHTDRQTERVEQALKGFLPHPGQCVGLSMRCRIRGGLVPMPERTVGQRRNHRAHEIRQPPGLDAAYILLLHVRLKMPCTVLRGSCFYT